MSIKQDVKKLNDTEKKKVEKLQEKFISIVKSNLIKGGLKGENKPLFKDLSKLSKEIVQSGIDMGTKWLSKNLN